MRKTSNKLSDQVLIEWFKGMFYDIALGKKRPRPGPQIIIAPIPKRWFAPPNLKSQQLAVILKPLGYC